MNRTELDAFTIHNLREIGRECGVKSPASLKRNVLIQSILDIKEGKLQPVSSNRGRPIKVRYNNDRAFLNSLSYSGSNGYLSANHSFNYDETFKKINIAKEINLLLQTNLEKDIKVVSPMGLGQSVCVICKDNRVKNLVQTALIQSFQALDEIALLPILYDATVEDLHYLNEKTKKNSYISDVEKGDAINLSLTKKAIEASTARCQNGENVVLILDMDKLAQTLKLTYESASVVKTEIIKQLISISGNYSTGSISVVCLTKGEDYFSFIADLFKNQLTIRYEKNILGLDTEKSFSIGEELFISSEALALLKVQRAAFIEKGNF